MKRALVCLAGVAVAGYLACAGPKTAAPPPAQPTLIDAAPKPPELVVDAGAAPDASASYCSARPARDEVRRAAVDAAVDAGLGHWLRGVSIEPALVRKRFRGWIVRSLYPNDPCYRDLDIQPGDVVTRVNGQSIERPEQAAEVFKSLKSAGAITVEYERAGAERTLQLRIVP